MIPTDLPEPVVPAISRWGMRARSATKGSPPIVSPSAIGSSALLSSNTFEFSSARRKTVSRLGLGSSMPIALRPGTTATRAAVVLIERAISSARLITREDFTPGAGSNSYRVTTGPGRTWTISPLTPKSVSTPCSSTAFWRRESSSTAPFRCCGLARRSRRGSLKPWVLANASEPWASR